MKHTFQVRLRRGNSTAPEDYKKVQLQAKDRYHAMRDAEIMNRGFKAESCMKL